MSFIVTCLFTTVASAQTKTRTIDDFYRYGGPDIDLQGSLGYHWDTVSRDAILGLGRLRGGYMWVTGYPWIVSAGVTMEINSYTSPVWGGQLEIMNFGAGLWARAGVGADYQAHPHFNGAIGWSLFGVELSGFTASPFDSRQGFAVLGTIRIPVGFIIYTVKKLH